jgi:hypothetical protein
MKRLCQLAPVQRKCPGSNLGVLTQQKHYGGLSPFQQAQSLSAEVCVYLTSCNIIANGLIITTPIMTLVL